MFGEPTLVGYTDVLARHCEERCDEAIQKTSHATTLTLLSLIAGADPRSPKRRGNALLQRASADFFKQRQPLRRQQVFLSGMAG